MADLKNVTKFLLDARAELEQLAERARRNLELELEQKKRELEELLRAADELDGLSFDSLFRSAAVVLVRECRLVGDRGTPVGLVDAGFAVRGGYVCESGAMGGSNQFMLRRNEGRDDGHQLVDGYYRVVMLMVKIEPPAPAGADKGAGDATH